MGNYAEAIKLRLEAQRLPSGDPFDPDNRRLRYLRYADDFVLGISGPKPLWVQILAARRRLTLVVFRSCHMDMHHGRCNPPPRK
ncbi:MAG: hypothetical protein OXD46_07925 [Chloroflexi bacterium]|nr:hypothetical protein [Chloroflexota bacterium]